MKYPENTIASFLAALYYGADGLELDVWLTRDRKLVVFHDPDTVRVVGEKLIVKDSAFNDLRRLDLGMGQRIPLLDEVIDSLPADIPLFVEIKDVEASVPAYQLVKERGRLESTAFISFYPEALERIRRVSNEAKLGFIIGSLESVKKASELAQKLNLYAVAPPVSEVEYLGKEKFINCLRKIRGSGLYTAAWVINTEEEYILVKHYVNAIITNNVEYLKQLLNQFH